MGFTLRPSASRARSRLKILELISTRSVRTQEELADALAADGWQVTQSSVSRDIASLRLAKVGGAYRKAPASSSLARDPDEVRIAEGVLTAEPAGDALVVVHTPPGEANRVGIALDRLAWPEIVGTIAGDDTIFLAVKNRQAQQRVMTRISGISSGPR